MPKRSYVRLNPPESYMTWGQTEVTVAVGETVTVTYSGSSPDNTRLNNSIGGIATATVGTGSVSLLGVSEGAVTIPYNTEVGNAVRSTNPLTITVTAPADDTNFLNERGLTHFWQGVDAAKQDKLPSGTVLTTRTELYNNNSGSAANITVSQALNNFDQVEIWFIDANSPANQLIRTIPGDAVGVVLDIPHPGGNSGVFWNIARWTWTAGATTLTYSSNHYQKALAASSLSTSSTNYILIRKVVGIKFTTL